MPVPEMEAREIKIADRTYIGIGLARFLVIIATLALGGISANLWNIFQLSDIVEDHISDDRGHLTSSGRRVLDIVQQNALAIERLTWAIEKMEDREREAHEHE